MLATSGSIFAGLLLPIAIGAVALIGFTGALGWLGDIFVRQTVRGQRWMWTAPALVVLAVVGHGGSITWDDWTAGKIAMPAASGICIGVAEELATRGVVVKMLRDAAHPERYVMVASSLLFSLMHTVNLLSGMELRTVAVTVLYTFGFGTCMYLTTRVTGTIWGAIVLHALTDPTGFLSTGGLDHAVRTQSGGWALLTTLATTAMIVFAFVGIFLVRDKRPTPSTRG